MDGQPKLSLTIGAPIGLALAASGSWFYARADGLCGLALALILALLSIGSLKMLSNSLLPTNSASGKASNLTVVVMLAKLPVVAVLIYLATRLSAPGLYCFLTVLGLVYCAIVWRLAGAAT